MKKYLPAILAVVFVAAMAAFLLIPNLVAPSSAPAPLPAAAAAVGAKPPEEEEETHLSFAEWRRRNASEETAQAEAQSERLPSYGAATGRTMTGTYTGPYVKGSAEVLRDLLSENPPRQPAAAARPTETSRGTPIIYDEDLPSGVSWTSTPSSDCFSRIGYDADEETLGVTFRSSEATYYYYGVPASVWRELSSAASKGGYYNEHIKGQYTCEKEG